MGKPSRKGTNKRANHGRNRKKHSPASGNQRKRVDSAGAESPPAEEKEEIVDHVDVEVQEENEKEEIHTEKMLPEEQSSLPKGLRASFEQLTEAQQQLATTLCSDEAKQEHLFEHWKESEEDIADVRRQMEQLEQLDSSYPAGGLLGYIKNAKDLLDKSRRGVNPLDGWKPAVPKGETFHLGTKEYEETETLGLPHVGKCGFVLVAGGLGERLGYGDIKIGLPTELATETCYIEFYIQTILAFQSKYAAGRKLPLCIMTSGDTNHNTVALLAKHNNFGMDTDQITIVQQGQGVPALENNEAKFAIDPKDPYRVQTKPHGHGDIHVLLHSHGVAKTWLGNGIQWVVFFQDTNGLAFHTLPLALGLSSKMGLVMNSLAVPRKAKQAIGGIALLTSSEGEQRTINVEYNQLDPLLRSNGFPDGDVNDETTGYSPFPGNINQLVFALGPYVDSLERTKGAMPEFVNPKYKDAEKTDFKSPTRLECMMQDFPTVLDGEAAKKVGFTCVDADICFSPVKNATADGIALQEKGIGPGVAASGEGDQYGAQAKILRSIGCNVGESAPVTFNGIKVQLTPAVVLKPNFVSCPAEYKAKFPTPSSVKLSSRSSLVVDGSGITIKSLDLDGALVIKGEHGAVGEIDGLVVSNKGWVNVEDKGSAVAEIIRMRGYRLSKLQATTIVFKKDGTIEGDYSPPTAEKSGVEEAAPVVEPVEPRSCTETKERTVVDETKPVVVTSAAAASNAAKGAALTKPADLTRPSTAEASAGKTTCGCAIL